ncbi:MAG: outer membrane protein assembly factor BamD [Spirochaetota bacterium]|nr:outer membrane protein assembly factor BamD [Spirochaetota bacterium]
MMTSRLILSIILALFVGDKLFASADKTIINTRPYKKFVISPKHSGKGLWRLDQFNGELFTLIMDRKKPFPYYIFQAKKAGTGTVKLIYSENGEMKKSKIYEVHIKSQDKEKTISAKSKRAYDFNMKINARKNHGTQRRFQRSRTAAVRNKLNNKWDISREIYLNQKAYLSYIKKLYNKKLYEKTLIHIDRFTKTYPRHPGVFDLKLTKGKILMRQNRYADAAKWYQALMRGVGGKSPVRGRLTLLLAKSYEKMGENQKAKISYITNLTLMKNPKILAETHFRLGNLYFKEKDYIEGIKEIETVVNDYPEAGEARQKSLYLLGEMYYKKTKLRNYKKSYQYFKALSKEFPRGPYKRKALNKMKYLEKNFIKYY